MTSNFHKNGGNESCLVKGELKRNFRLFRKSDKLFPIILAHVHYYFSLYFLTFILLFLCLLIIFFQQTCTKSLRVHNVAVIKKWFSGNYVFYHKGTWASCFITFYIFFLNCLSPPHTHSLSLHIYIKLGWQVPLKARTPDGDRDTDYFDFVAGVLQGDTLAPYLFIFCLDYRI